MTPADPGPLFVDPKRGGRRCLRCGGDPRYLPPDFACAHQLPPYVLRLLAIGIVTDDEVRVRIPSWQPGRLLAAYDPAVGVDSIVVTANPAEALQFAEAGEALDLWRAVDPNDPLRPDGKPNRPLTAFTVEPVVMPPGGCFHHDPHPVRRGGPLLCQTCGQLEHPSICHDPVDGTLACCCGLEDGLLREAERVGEALTEQEQP